MNAIEVNGVSRAYPGFLLDHISFSLPTGTILGLVGENGAGKSTLMKLILGMIRADSGSVSVLGYNDLRVNPKIREDLGVVMDESCFPAVMKAAEIGTMLSMFYRNWDETDFEHLLAMLGIPKDKMFGKLSRGNKMKLGIACALSHHPKLLILDEATSGLDPVVRDELLDILLDFTRDESHSILMSSHIVSDLEKACDYIVFLHEGRILLSGEKDLLLEQYGKVCCSRERFAQISSAAVIGKRETDYGVECIAGREALSGAVKVQPVGLEELFVMMVKGGKE